MYIRLIEYCCKEKNDIVDIFVIFLIMCDFFRFISYFIVIVG